MNTIQLIGVGTVNAIPASEVREGDVRLYNYYGTGTIVKVIEKTAKTLTFITEENGEYYMFDIRKSSLVAISKRDQDISLHKPTHAKHRKNGMVDVTEYFPAEQTEEEKLEAYHIELQERGMALTESKPEVNAASEYKVIVSKDRENGLIGEFEVVLSGEELEFRLMMNEVMEIIEEVTSNDKESLNNKLKHKEESICKLYQTLYSLPEEQYSMALNNINGLKKDVAELKTAMLKIESDSMEQLFYSDDITNGQSYTINILMNKWKGLNYTYKAVYKEESNRGIVVLQVLYNGNEICYYFNIDGSLLFEKSHFDTSYQQYAMVYDFSDNTNLKNEAESVTESINETEISIDITVNHNEEKDSVEVSFSEKPDQERLEQLKAYGFRWSRYNKVWYKKNPSEEVLNFIESLGSKETTYSNGQEENRASLEYPEIEINDVESYTISEELQQREHDAHWIFRQQKKDHTKDIQSLFTEYNNKVMEVIETTDNQSIIYNLKKSLQYFKKHYHEGYIKWLSGKANTPSWAVTGRAGRNMNAVNKKMEQVDNHLRKLIEIQSDMDSKLNKAVKQIKKIEEDRITAELEKEVMDLKFKMVKKEWEYMGMKENRKVHTYGDYWIANTWGSFKIFKHNQLIHSCKSTESLIHAKKYLVYHIKQSEQKAV